MSISFFQQLLNRKSYFSKIEPRYLCKICNDVMINPIQSSCGCRFCNSCITKYSENSSICPSCNEPFESKIFQTDKAIEREILKLQMKCINKNCEESVNVEQLNDHLSNCQFREFFCPKCHEMMSYNEFNYHNKQSCPLRDIKCQFCNESMTYKHLNEVHLNPKYLEEICDKWYGHCPLNCVDKTTNLHIKSHLKECENVEIECDLYMYGCHMRGNKKQILQHNTDHMAQHLLLLKKQIELVTKLQDTDRNVDHLKKINEELQTTVNQMKTKMDLQQKEIDGLKKSINQTKMQISDANGETLEFCSSTVPNSIQNNFNEDIMSEFSWKVDNIHTLIHNVKEGSINNSILSDPFYTAQPGYHMRLKLFPNGDGEGKDSYVSIYFMIIRGQYDDLNKWPFQRRLSVSLLASRSSVSDISVKMRPDNNLSCYGRPEMEFNMAVGLPKFVLQNVLFDSDRYIHENNAIIIRFKTRI